MRPSRPRSSGPGPRLIGIALLVSVLVVVLLVAASYLAGRKLEAVERTWAEEPGSTVDRLARYPNREVNEAALEVERASASLGIWLAP